MLTNEMHYVGDSTFDPSIAKATYDPGAKLNWHIHPGGQVLRITERTGPLPVARSLEWCIQWDNRPTSIYANNCKSPDLV